MICRRDEMRHLSPTRARRSQNCRHGAAGRGGFTLIEILVVVTLSSIVMSVIVAVLVALIQKDRQVRLFGVHNERQGDLAEMIRTDIRAADDVSLAAQTVLLIEAAEQRAETFAHLFDLARRGRLRTKIERAHALEDFRAAIARASQSERAGKILFSVS